MDNSARIAERKILESIEKGEFRDLPGKGRPLTIEDLSLVPEEMRLCYMILKNSGYLPPEMELRKEILSIESVMEDIDDEGLLEETLRALNQKIVRLNILERKSLPLEKKQYYVKVLREKLKPGTSKGVAGDGSI